jgi:hypothetical protein
MRLFFKPSLMICSANPRYTAAAAREHRSVLAPRLPTPKWDTLGKAQDRPSAASQNDVWVVRPPTVFTHFIGNRNGSSRFFSRRILIQFLQVLTMCGTATLTKFCHAMVRRRRVACATRGMRALTEARARLVLRILLSMKQAMPLVYVTLDIRGKQEARAHCARQIPTPQAVAAHLVLKIL